MAKQPRSLYGLVAAVTGGARGIGLATATALTREGMKVAIGDLDGDLAASEASKLGSGAIGLPLDVTDRDSFATFLDQVEEQLGPLEVLVNNAGIMHLTPFLDEEDEWAVRQVDINLHGVIAGSKLGLRRFTQRGHGHLINIASTAGKAGFPGGATYCATKHAVVGLSEAIRQELRGTGVEVGCVMPGVVQTELAAGLAEARGFKPVTPQEVAAEIVDALKRPRFDIYVPRSIGRINKLMSILPRAGREGIARALKADKVLTAIDHNARNAYELRAAKSEPSLDSGAEQKALSP
jgi:NAD(P)-dependent dehydrogenase (short-subunit alcohol dehydrogenase family)